MHLYDVALFLHIATLLTAIGLGTTLHHAEWQTRSATTVQELRVMTRVLSKGVLFPPILLVLFGTGAWLLHLSKKEDEQFHFSDPWVWTAIVAIVLLFISGGAVLGRHAGGYRKLLAATPDGSIPAEVRAETFRTDTWVTSHMNTALAISVVFNMVTKPSDDLSAIVTVVIGFVAGCLIGAWALQRAKATTTG